MRFIDLTNEEKKTPFDTILQVGCGPNFVLNRLDSFEVMIKEQGVVFWFRFWLKFCLNPPSAVLRKIHTKWPDKLSSLTIGIHKHFLEGTTDDAIKYCLEHLIVQLRTPKNDATPKKDINYKSKTDYAILECVEMTFGASLCEVFSFWLKAVEEEESMTYWTLPQEYLDPEFEARDLEKFLIGYWKESLLPLLGIKLVRQIPWLMKWTVDCSDVRKTNQEIFQEDGVDMEEFIYLSPYLISIAQIMEALTNHQEEVRRIVLKADDLPDIGKIWNIAKVASKMKHEERNKVNILSMLLEKLSRDKKNAHISSSSTQEKDDTDSCKDYKDFRDKNGEGQLRQCACCMKDIEMSSGHRVCKRCIAENWRERRHYCSDGCQMDHWFQMHHNEHKESMRKLATKIYRNYKPIND